MILTDEQIVQHIESPHSKDLLEKSINDSRKLSMHINGTNVVDYIAQISNFENDEQIKLRKNTAISNRYLFNSIIRIVNKIFSAKGGSVYYTMPAEQDKDFRTKLSDIKGLTLRKWMQNKAMNKYLTDPNGVFLIENKMVRGERFAYPTYKSSASIHDYQHTGRQLEYLIMKVDSPDKKQDWYRVYDDASDRIVALANHQITEIQELTFRNLWGEVPGFVIGDLPHDVHEMYDSRFSLAMELADKHLRTNSVKNVYEFAHGFPLMWRMLTAKCSGCNGTGYINSKMHAECKGTGYQLRKDVSDIVGVIPPKTADEPKLVPDIAGYVQPDLETWQEFRTELTWCEKLIQYAILGSYTRDKTGAETATGVWVDVQPVNDSLDNYREWAEETEKFITDFLGKYYFDKLYEGCSVNLGQRYMIEKPDDLWKKYLDSRKQGAPTEKLDDDIVEYYESKYMNDAQTLEIQKRLFFANPYRHTTLDEAKTNLPQSQYLIRVYYDYWVSQIKEEDVIKAKDYQAVQDLFIKFANQKITENAKDLLQESGGQKNGKSNTAVNAANGVN